MVKKVNRKLAYHKERILTILWHDSAKTPMKPCLNTGSLFWPAYLKTELGWWKVQHEKQRWWMGETGLKYQERKKHALFSIEKILLRGDMTEVFIIATGYKK